VVKNRPGSGVEVVTDDEFQLSHKVDLFWGEGGWTPNLGIPKTHTLAAPLRDVDLRIFYLCSPRHVGCDMDYLVRQNKATHIA